MNRNEKMDFIKDLLETSQEKLDGTELLRDMEEWDSLAKLSLIVELKKMGISLSTVQLKELKTLNDICDCIPD